MVALAAARSSAPAAALRASWERLRLGQPQRARFSAVTASLLALRDKKNRERERKEIKNKGEEKKKSQFRIVSKIRGRANPEQ